jgi:hypothetical protein
MQTSATDAEVDGGGLRRGRLNRVGLGWLARRSGAVATAGTIAVLVMTVGGVISGETFMNSWTQNPTQPYIETLSTSLAAHPGPVYLFGNEVVPDKVMTPTFLADREIQHITRPMPVRPQVSQAVPYFSVVDDTGHLHDGAVRGYNLPFPKAVCALENKPAAILLPVAPGAGRWTLRLGYLGNRQTTAKVSIGVQPPVTMRLEKDLHEIYISLQAGGSDQLLLSGLDHDASICIGSATLGFPVAKP